MPNGPTPSSDLTRTILAVLCIAALIFCAVTILLPFLSASLWATTIVVSTWPLLLRVEAGLGHRRGLAAAVMTVALLVVVLLPLSLAIGVLAVNMGDIVAKVKSFTIPGPPDWIAGIPLQGPRLAEIWRRLAAEGPASFSAGHSREILQWTAARVGGVGSMIVQFIVTVILSAVLFVHGETAAHGVRRFALRLAGANGDRVVVLAASTIQSVARGIVITALVQSVISGAGLLLTSVPASGLLTAAVFLLCVAQLGPLPVMLPAVAWKFYTGTTVSGIVLLVFTLLASTLDNVIRPMLIRKGADLPLLLIIAGVIGGMLSFGVMGIFVGPVLLSVTYVLLRQWVETAPTPERAGESTAASAGSG